MWRIEGLSEYVELKEYKEALAIPRSAEVEYVMLAQGEYNINYLFRHPVTRKKLLLRVNCGSQMHLEHQIEYEYGALKQLEQSGRTPAVFYVDGTLEHLKYGVLVMEFLEGRPLDYTSDLAYAAECLADIHAVRLDRPQALLCPEQPLKAILTECVQMFDVYLESPLGVPRIKHQISQMLNWMRDKVERIEKAGEHKVNYRCCINTELNSTNFLINGDGKRNYLIDWEKPLLGEPAQDLGHFLAPTTTFWKTDVILTADEIAQFISVYKAAVGEKFPVDGLEERIYMFIPVTCLRGLTWCAMAWIQYHDPEKAIFNESTYIKLNSYLSEKFLSEIEILLGMCDKG